MNRKAIDRLPRLWIDIPSSKENGNDLNNIQGNFKIKASFSKKSPSTK